MTASEKRLSLLLIGLLLTAAAAFGQPAAIDGHWQGKIEVPGSPLLIDLDFVTAGGTTSGDISIPVQGLKDLTLAEVVVAGNDVDFRMPGIPGDPTFDGTLSEDGQRIDGTFTQGGVALDFELAREESPAAAARTALAGFGNVVEKAVADWNVPGGGLAVVRNGEVVLAEGFGHRDLEQDLAMTADSLFAIGSTTKAFTATVLGMLSDEGSVEWDQPLRAYLPGFRLHDPVATELITPRDLVTHRSGLPRHDLLWYNNNQGTRSDVVTRLAHLAPSAGLREKFQYNNLMFLTAGHLIEQLTGGTWEEAVRARILEPLGMKRTTFTVADSQQDPDHALPYREDDDDQLERIPFRPIQLIGPAGALNSSVHEMSRWLLFNLSGGMAGGERLINATTLADVHSPHMTTGAAPDRPEISQPTYGLGWMIDTYRGHRRVHHGGGIDGFSTSVMLFPDDDLGLVAFTNRGSGLPGILNRHAADLILGLDPIDWNGEALERRAKAKEATEEAEKKKDATRRPGTIPSHDLAEYAGDYQHPGYGTLAIRLEDGALSMTFNDITSPLEHWHYDVWNGAEVDGDKTFEDQKLIFRGDVHGEIAAVEAAFEPQVDAIVFEKRPDARLSDPDYLRRLAGVYQMPGQRVTIELAGGVLTVTLPGQPQYTLVPDVSGRFVLEEYSIITVGFTLEGDGNATAITFYQPNGVFEAKRVE